MVIQRSRLSIEGEIYVLGGKDLIIRAGRNIYPAELETAIGTLDGYSSVAVFASSSPDWY